MGTDDRVKILASKETAKERYAICMKCEDLNKLKQCSHCGCFVIAKTRFNTSPCPLNKWQ